MKGIPIFLTLTVLLLAGCASTLTPDVESSVQVAVAATLTAQPTETPMETPTRTPTHDVESTVQVAVAATLTAQPTKTSMPTPTETPTRTPTPKATPTLALPPTKTPSPFTISLETYESEGVSFQYPANARLEDVVPNRHAWEVVSIATSEIHVIGPKVWVKPGDADWSYRGPAYNLTIRTYENPEELDPESWARNYVLASWQEARERNRPWGALPVSEEGEIDESKVGSAIVAGQPAFWVNYFTFDSTCPTYYLTSDHQIIELSFTLYPVANQPLAMVQRDVYALILSTLHLEESESALLPSLTIEAYALKDAPRVEPLAFEPVQGTAKEILQKRQVDRGKRVGGPLAVGLSTTLLGQELVATVIHTDTVEGQVGAVQVTYGGSVIYSVPVGPANPVGGL